MSLITRIWVYMYGIKYKYSKNRKVCRRVEKFYPKPAQRRYFLFRTFTNVEVIHNRYSRYPEIRKHEILYQQCKEEDDTTIIHYYRAATPVERFLARIKGDVFHAYSNGVDDLPWDWQAFRFGVRRFKAH